MNIGRAFTFIFDDRDWLNKIIIVVIFTFAAIVFSPVLFGLAAWAILFGYQLDIIRTFLYDDPTPLPAWNDFGRLLVNGAGMLIAYFVYMLPNAFAGAFTWLVTAASGDTSIVSGGVSIGVACCLFPILLVYNLVAMPMFTIAQGRYAEEGRLGIFFQFGALFDTLRTHLNDVIQWWIGTIIALFVLSFLMAIPCLGWLAASALMIPVLGAISGMFAANIAKRTNG